WTTAAWVAEAGRLERPRATRTPTCFRDRLLIQPDHFHDGPSVGVAPTTSSVPGTSSHSLSSKGMASPARLERATPAFGRRCSVHTELRRGVASTAGVEPAPSGFVDRRLDPFGHVDMAPPAGLAPATSGLTGRRYHCAELRPHGGPGGNRTPSVG